MNRKLYFLAMVPLIFPILSREDIIPWLIVLFFMRKSFKNIKSNIDANKKVFSNIVFSALGVVLFNILSVAVQNYFSKLLL